MLKPRTIVVLLVSLLGAHSGLARDPADPLFTLHQHRTSLGRVSIQLWELRPSELNPNLMFSGGRLLDSFFGDGEMLEQYALLGFEAKEQSIEPGQLIGLSRGKLIRFDRKEKTWSRIQTPERFRLLEPAAEQFALAVNFEGEVFKVSTSGQVTNISPSSLSKILEGNSVVAVRTTRAPTESGASLGYALLTQQKSDDQNEKTAAETRHRLVLVENARLRTINLTSAASERISDFLTDGQNSLWYVWENTNQRQSYISHFDLKTRQVLTRKLDVKQSIFNPRAGEVSLLSMQDGALYAQVGEHFTSFRMINENQAMDISVEKPFQFSTQLAKHGITVGPKSRLTFVQPRLADWAKSKRTDVEFRGNLELGTSVLKPTVITLGDTHTPRYSKPAEEWMRKIIIADTVFQIDRKRVEPKDQTSTSQSDFWRREMSGVPREEPEGKSATTPCTRYLIDTK